MRLFTDVAARIDDPFMRRAFELAEMGRGRTSPNPMVGCVIAQDDEIVGEGYHTLAGGIHAEVAAIRQAGPRAAGATAYVTLEPCNHFGRTPPCSEALISRAIAGVVIGMPDPNPIAVGGHVRMREAGLEVEFEADPTPYEIQNEAWLHFVRTGRPFVQVKIALSLDGHATAANGVRTAITHSGGAAVNRLLREAADAVVVGANTAYVDAPSLTVRDENGLPSPRQPLRVAFGRTGVPDAALFHDGLGPSAALVPESRLAEVPKGVTTLAYDDAGGLSAAIGALGRHGAVRVLVEAGPALLTSLLEAELADELVVLHGGGMLGKDAPASFLGEVGENLERMHSPLAALEAGVSGEDAVTVWRPISRG